MYKAGTVFLCAMMTVIFLGVLNASGQTGEELCIPTGSITLEPPDGVEQKRASVDFPHSVHFSYTCQECHHTWNGNDDVKGCATSGCHSETATPKDEKTGKPIAGDRIKYYKNAFHQACIGCHKEIKEKNKEIELSKKDVDAPLTKTGPTGCVKCHPKED